MRARRKINDIDESKDQPAQPMRLKEINSLLRKRRIISSKWRTQRETLEAIASTLTSYRNNDLYEYNKIKGNPPSGARHKNSGFEQLATTRRNLPCKKI